MRDYIFDEVCVKTWGLNKTVELVLIAICAATVSVIIGDHLIPNNPVTETTEKEN